MSEHCYWCVCDECVQHIMAALSYDGGVSEHSHIVNNHMLTSVSMLGSLVMQ